MSEARLSVMALVFKIVVLRFLHLALEDFGVGRGRSITRAKGVVAVKVLGMSRPLDRLISCNTNFNKLWM